jgi:hypothetical protein
MNQTKYHTRARLFLEDRISQTYYIAKNNLSKYNTGPILQILDHLSKYLKAYPFKNDKQMAKFFLNNQKSINGLVNPKHINVVGRFESLVAESHSILNESHVQNF